jgi:Holliday junction resolvase RusA-like endonuclease
MTRLEFTVLGLPAPQGSKHGRPIYRGTGAAREFTGAVAQVESSKSGVATWRGDVVRAATEALRVGPEDDQGMAERTSYPFGIGPVHVDIVFIFPRPKHHYRTGRNAHLLRDTAPTLHTHKPDVDKLLRSTFDALTTAGVWKDDAQVAGLSGDPMKRYSNGHEDLPGARIKIRSCG